MALFSSGPSLVSGSALFGPVPSDVILQRDENGNVSKSALSCDINMDHVSDSLSKGIDELIPDATSEQKINTLKTMVALVRNEAKVEFKKMQSKSNVKRKRKKTAKLKQDRTEKFIQYLNNKKIN